MLRVALFAQKFLEPTHHAVASILASLSECEFIVFAKHIMDYPEFQINNVAKCIYYSGDHVPDLRGMEFDLVHAIYDGKTALHASSAASVARLPYVLSYHGGFDTQAKIQDPRYRDGTRIVTERAFAVTVPSKMDVERLRDIGVTCHIHVVPVPIDPLQLPRAPEKCEKHLVVVGRLIPKKGIDIALKMLDLLGPEYRLSIIGDGPLRGELEALARHIAVDNRVTWYGLLSLSRTLDVVGKAGVLLHPSRMASDNNADGITQIVLWAMAMRVPVVATISGSLPEIVRHECTGWLVPPEDPDAMARCVIRLEANLEQTNRVCANAVTWVQEHHNLSAVAAQIGKIYQDVCGQSNSFVPE